VKVSAAFATLPDDTLVWTADRVAEPVNETEPPLRPSGEPPAVTLTECEPVAGEASAQT
jgi:hypothetical protein